MALEDLKQYLVLIIKVDFITPTVVEGFQIFNVLADQVLHENSGYETFIKGLQSFAFSYSTDAQPGSFIEKVSNVSYTSCARKILIFGDICK